MNGTCTLKEGSKQIAEFKTDEILECMVLKNRHGRRHRRSTYSPKLVLKNGKVFVISGFADPRSRTTVENFCKNIVNETYFKYSVK